MFNINPKIKEKIVLALDVNTIDEAEELILELKDYVGIFKVGLQFYTDNGDKIFDLMNQYNLQYFLDVKFMDIPNTVAKASENIIRKGASFYNVHALGGFEMMQKSAKAAAEIAARLGREVPTILAVTLLTSISQEILDKDFGIEQKTDEFALKLAKLAKDAGLTGVVASVFEARKIKELCGKDFKVLCPGIRPEWASKDDQKRLATPKLALQEGADYLVIGRAVTSAGNRVEAMQKIYKEMDDVLENKKIKVNYKKTATLMLQNGMIFEGESFGASGTIFGEAVFNTSMTGYQEILTDPSYARQVVVMTYPEIGNYGINDEDFESDRVQPTGFVVKNYSEKDCHYKSVRTLSKYLKINGVVGISGIDTRALTKVIREEGTMACVLTTEPVTDKLKSALQDYCIEKDLVSIVSRKKTSQIKGDGINLAVIDLGIKNSILKEFKKMGCNITIFPSDVSAETIKNGDFDALFLSNGPGDPQEAKSAIETTKQLFGKLPIFGICLGFQILGIVAGASTYKLKYGHRGGNHSVADIRTNKVLITAQNHGYAVDESTLPKDIVITYKNLNDGTLEGFEYPKFKVYGVQFHPEAAPGPADANIIIKTWVNIIKKVENYAKK